MAQVTVFHEINEMITLAGAVQKAARHIQEKDLSVIRDAAMVVENGKILWRGKKQALPSQFKRCQKKSLGHLNVFPGFVECHTHLIFAGDRTNEFEMRNQGFSYQDIAKQGGGILSTVKATRKATEQELVSLGQERVNRFLSQGVTTIEVKSGYGLNEASELKILRAAQKLKRARIVSTYLGAHALPKEFSSEKDYLQSLQKTLRKIKQEKLSERIDIFIENGYFSVESAREYLIYAQSLGFAVTIHADQLTRTGATKLATELSVQSADHAICLNDSDIAQIAQSNTTAVLLPAADFYLSCPYPPARSLIDGGARCALATDFNPGTSPTQSLSLVGLLARLNMKMTLPEVFVAMTLGGAYALGKEESIGALEKDMQADFFTSPVSWRKFFYDASALPISKVFVAGKVVSKTNASFN